MARPKRRPTEPDLSPRLASAVLAALVLMVFARLFVSEFTTWDDEPFIGRNPLFINAGLDSLVRCWRMPFYDIYIPVTTSVWTVVAMAARSEVPDDRGLLLNPYLFHAINVLVHAGASIAVFALLRRMFQRSWPALAGALVFALHPVQVESVAWASGLKDLLAGLFSVGAIYAYLGAVQAADARQRRKHYVTAVVVFTLGLLAKPSAMTTAGVLVAIDVLLLQRPVRTIAMWTAPVLLLAVACAAFARWLQPAIPEAHDVPLWGRPLIVGYSLAFYAGKILWPAALAVDYGHHPDALWAGTFVKFAWIVPAALLVAAIVAYRRSRWPLVALAVLAIAPLHTLGLVGYDFQFFSTVADHYLYTAMLGIAMLAAWAFTLLPKNAAIGITVVLGLAMGIRSFVQTASWKDSTALYDHTLAVNPNSWAIRSSQAAAAIERQDFHTAMELARQAIQERPEYPVPYLTLATAKRHLGDIAGAEQAYRQSLAIARKVETLTNLGGLLAEHGRLEEAEQLLRESIQHDPVNTKGYLNLGVMRAKEQNFPEAVKWLEHAVRLDPADGDAQFMLGLVLVGMDRRAEGIAHLRTAARLQPTNPKIAQVLRELGAGPG